MFLEETIGSLDAEGDSGVSTDDADYGEPSKPRKGAVPRGKLEAPVHVPGREGRSSAPVGYGTGGSHHAAAATRAGHHLRPPASHGRVRSKASRAAGQSVCARALNGLTQTHKALSGPKDPISTAGMDRWSRGSPGCPS